MDSPPYSRVRRTDSLVFTAGIIGQVDGQLADGAEAQLTAAFDNLEALLGAEGLGMDDVLRLVVYLTDIAQMEVLNQQFTARFDQPRPVRSTVAVEALPGGSSVEIEATASARPAGSL